MHMCDQGMHEGASEISACIHAGYRILDPSRQHAALHYVVANSLQIYYRTQKLG